MVQEVIFLYMLSNYSYRNDRLYSANHPGGITLASNENVEQTTIGSPADIAVVAPSLGIVASALPEGPPNRGPVTVISGSPVSTRPKQTVHHNEPKGNIFCLH